MLSLLVMLFVLYLLRKSQLICYKRIILLPSEIRSRKPFNLNEMSHKAAIDMLKELLRMKIRISEVFIDTVGDPAKYESKLQHIFSFTSIKFKVSKKADALYKCVSAASIVAKVVFWYN